MLQGIKGFEWDRGNKDKNELKHGVTSIECEEIFFNTSLIIVKNQRNLKEERYTALGQTREKRLLFVVFTLREQKIRVVSARPMSRKERKLYEKEKTEVSSGI